MSKTISLTLIFLPTLLLSQRIDLFLNYQVDSKITPDVSGYKQTEYNAVAIQGTSLNELNYRSHEYNYFTFDDSARLVKRERFYTLEPVSMRKSTVEYDLEGRPKKYSEFPNKATVANAWENFVYDENENSITIKKYEDKKLTGTKKYFWNEDSLITERHDINSSGEHIWTTLFTYDTLGNMTSETLQTADGVLSSKTAYSYNLNNQLITKKEYDEANKLKMTSSYTYNSNGGVLKINRTYGSNKNSTTYTYEYDERGNWVVRDEVPSNGAVVKVVREFTYR